MDSVQKISDSYQSQFASDIMTLASASVTLYVLWKGYQTLAGKTQTPLPDLAWDLAKFAIIITFVTNAGGYLTSATTAMEGLKDGMSGGVSVWHTLDNLWSSTQNLSEKIYQKDTDYVPLAGAFGMALVWAGSIILMAVSTVVYLAADVTMKLLIITAPIFIFCLMFGFLRQMFNNWLQLNFSSILTVLFASLVIRIGMDYQGEILQQVSNAAPDSNVVTAGAMGFMAGLLSALLVLLARMFATQLAGAGVDGAVQGMAMMGLGVAGAAASKLGMSGGKAGFGLYQGLLGKKSSATASTANRLGNSLGRGTRSAADWVGNNATNSVGAKERRNASLEKAKSRNAA